MTGQVTIVFRRPWWAFWRRHTVFEGMAALVDLVEGPEGWEASYRGVGDLNERRPWILKRRSASAAGAIEVDADQYTLRAFSLGEMEGKEG